MNVPDVVHTTSPMIAHMATLGPDSQSHHDSPSTPWSASSAGGWFGSTTPIAPRIRCSRPLESLNHDGPLDAEHGQHGVDRAAAGEHEQEHDADRDRTGHRREVERGAEERPAVQPPPVEHQRQEQRQHGLQRDHEQHVVEDVPDADHEVVAFQAGPHQQVHVVAGTGQRHAAGERAALPCPLRQADPERHQDRDQHEQRQHDHGGRREQQSRERLAGPPAAPADRPRARPVSGVGVATTMA